MQPQPACSNIARCVLPPRSGCSLWCGDVPVSALYLLLNSQQQCTRSHILSCNTQHVAGVLPSVPYRLAHAPLPLTPAPVTTTPAHPSPLPLPHEAGHVCVRP
jgi:hypothetical protein